MIAVSEFLKEWKDAFGAIQSIFTIFALIVGGLWAYFKIFAGRTYRRRLEPSVTGHILSSHSHSCVTVKMTIRNVGLSRVELDRESCTLSVRMYRLEDYEPEFHNAIWADLGTVQAVEDHEWIEPGEVVTEERLLALPNMTPIAIELRMRIIAKRRKWMPLVRRIEWNARAVVAAIPLELGSSALQGAGSEPRSSRIQEGR